MAIASAGSLCAGYRELPPGARRGYSVIEIDDECKSARVHVREMAVANLYSRANLPIFGGRSYVDLEWTVPKDAAGRPENPSAERRTGIIQQAEDALYSKHNPGEALRLLKSVELEDTPFIRQLILEAVRQLGDDDELIQCVGIPMTIEELVLKFDAQLRLGNRAGAAETIAQHAGRLDLPEAVRMDMEARMKLSDWTEL